MSKRTRPILPRAQRRIRELGQRLRLARLRRGIPLVEMAARVGVTRPTLRRLEQGDASVALAVLIRLLGVLGFEEDIDRMASQDEVGRRLEDLRLTRPRRTTSRTTTP